MTGAELAAAAERLVGSPFRLHGRDPATGLDCIGVLYVALRDVGRQPVFPNGYRLRGRTLPDLTGIAERNGLTPSAGPRGPGDVSIHRVGPCQVHLIVAAGEGFVHAHAGLRRVVLSPGPPPAIELGRWRLETISWQR